MARYRIIYVNHKGDPCHWQAQERVWLILWKNLFGSTEHADTAAIIINNLVMIGRK